MIFLYITNHLDRGDTHAWLFNKKKKGTEIAEEFVVLCVSLVVLVYYVNQIRLRKSDNQACSRHKRQLREKLDYKISWKIEVPSEHLSGRLNYGIFLSIQWIIVSTSPSLWLLNSCIIHMKTTMRVEHLTLKFLSSIRAQPCVFERMMNWNKVQ